MLTRAYPFLSAGSNPSIRRTAGGDPPMAAFVSRIRRSLWSASIKLGRSAAISQRAERF